jgi:hypothetical protein
MFAPGVTQKLLVIGVDLLAALCWQGPGNKVCCFVAARVGWLVPRLKIPGTHPSALIGIITIATKFLAKYVFQRA